MKASDRIVELDGLRGIAVILVIIWHYVTCQYYGDNKIFSLLITPTKIFWSGVDLFFVLSGFLIGGIILAHHKKPNFLRVFWIRRVCRILPASLLLLAFYLITKNMDVFARFDWLYSREMPTLSYLTYTQNIFMGIRGTFGANFMAVTWSLAVEEQFYIIAPLLVLLFGKDRWVKLLIPIALLALVLRIAFPGFHTHVGAIFRMDALLLGFAVAAVFADKHAWRIVTEHRYLVMSGLIAILILIALLGYTQSAFHEMKFFWFAVFYSAMLMMTLIYRGSNWLSFLRSPFLTFWGSLAFGLYLYHQAIAGLLHGYFRNGASPNIGTIEGAGLTVLSLIITVILAIASFHWFESYFIKLGKNKRYS